MRDVRDVFPWAALASVAVAGTLAAAAGCGGGNDEKPPPVQANQNIQGVWRQVGIAVGDLSSACPGSVPLPGGGRTSCGDNDTALFNGQSQVAFAESGRQTSAGTYQWWAGGRVLTLNLSVPPQSALPDPETGAAMGFDGQTLSIANPRIPGRTDFYQRVSDPDNTPLPGVPTPLPLHLQTPAPFSTPTPRPSGTATARCNDGSFSFAEFCADACQSHDGILEELGCR